MSKKIVNPTEIRRWAEARGGKPASVKRTGKANDAGLLRIMFEGYGDDSDLEEISWNDFLNKFDEKKLALVVEDEKGGELSRFNKLINR